MILLSTSVINVDSCVFAVARPKYCMCLILHWSNKHFCCISFNLMYGNLNISAFSKVVSIPLTCHYDCTKWEFHHCIEFLTHQKLQSFFLSMRFCMSQMSNNVHSVISTFRSISKTAWKKWKQIFLSTSLRNG